MNNKIDSSSNQIIRVMGHWVVVLILAAVAPTTVQAQWTIEPIIKVGAERDDNATLTVRTDDILDVSGFLYDISARFSYQSALTNFYITPQLLSRNYSDHPEIDSDDIFVRSLWSHQRRSSLLRLGLRYDNQTVRTAERAGVDLDVDDPDEIPEDDTGFVGFQDTRERLRITPSWAFDFSNAMSMRISLDYLDTTYDESLQLFLNDYTDTRLTAALNRDFSERTTGIALLTGRQYEVSNSPNDTDGVGLMVGFQRSLSETTITRVLVGFEDTDSNISELDPTFIADISLRRRLETVNFLAQYRRSVSASGSGRLSVRNSINLNLSRMLSERITAGLGVRAYDTDSLDDVLTIDERNYVQLRAQFIWGLSTNFSIEADYRYTFQDRAALGESSNSNQVNLWFSYRPNSIDRRFRQ